MTTCESTPNTAPDNCAVLRVAVAVIVTDDGKALVSRRPDHVHQGGLWEFPGGKLEASENAVMALKREIREELGIEIRQQHPLIRIPYRYPDKSVILDVLRVSEYSGTPVGMEGQCVKWIRVSEMDPDEFPAANFGIIQALKLPDRYLITGSFRDEEDFLRRLKRALNGGVRLVQLRAHHLSDTEYHDYAHLALACCREYNARLLLNAAPSLLEKIPVSGIHLNSHRLMAQHTRPATPDKLVGASCHNLEQLQHATAIGVDFIVLSPVFATKSHPNAVPMGWFRFEELVERCPIPAFALGGVEVGHLNEAQRHGAQGVAGISTFWG